MDVYKALTLLVAGAALGLSVFNTWFTTSKDRLRVEVIPTYFRDEDLNYHLGLVVRNLSSFDVTLEELRLKLGSGQNDIPGQFTDISNNPWQPIRLLSRESTSVFIPDELVAHSAFRDVTAVVVKTGCGKVIYGRNNALTTAVEEGRGALLALKALKSRGESKNG